MSTTKMGIFSKRLHFAWGWIERMENGEGKPHLIGSNIPTYDEAFTLAKEYQEQNNCRTCVVTFNILPADFSKE
jgi:hypothetical protein